jgi:uncharacterized protein (TIGR02453 family)
MPTPAPSSGFRPAALTFLRRLKRNNQRDWFQEHRDAYDHDLMAPLRQLVEEMDVRFARFAPEIVGHPKRSVFRIYRDTRFSKDKSPYKTNAGLWFQHRNASHGVGTETHGAGAGFYFHLEPGASFVAGGIWMPPRPTLNAIRDRIAAKPAEFAKSMSSTAFKRRFGKLSEEAMLKRLPRGFDPGHPAEPWLRFQSFTVSAQLTDAQVCDRKLPDRLAKDYEVILPMVRWINVALGYPPANRR